MSKPQMLTHWGRVTHICISNLTIIGSNNGLSPGRRQAIVWTNTGKLFIRTIGKNSVKFQSKFRHFHKKNAFENVIWKITAILFHPQCVNGRGPCTLLPVPILTAVWLLLMINISTYGPVRSIHSASVNPYSGLDSSPKLDPRSSFTKAALMSTPMCGCLIVVAFSDIPFYCDVICQRMFALHNQV